MKTPNLPRSLAYPIWWDYNNKRAMLICRISDRKQLDGVSLDAQEYNLREYAKRVGLQVVAVRSFQESAKDSSARDAFHAAVREAKKSNIRHVVFYVHDRIARNFTDVEELEKQIRAGQFVLHIATGDKVLHRKSPAGDFFIFDIQMAQAKNENRERGQKSSDGMLQRCRNGWYPSRPPSFYWQEPARDQNGRMKKRGSTVAGPTPEGLRLVRREMELHQKGFSLGRIRNTCLSEGLVPPDLVPKYRTSAIDKHLKNEFYAALRSPHDGLKSQFLWKGELYEGRHEPIFTADEWELLQQSFGKKSRYRKLKHKGRFAEGELTLSCADPSCGCKITFAPKTKGTGQQAREYRYYRCADGKRAHSDKGEKQVNVAEEVILDGLGAALSQITITEDVATAIAHALNANHADAKAARRRDADIYRAQLVALDAKENALVEALTSHQLDADVYRRQQLRLRQERAELQAKQRANDEAFDDAYLFTAQRVLELAKTAKNTWNQRSADEKRNLLSKVVCNPRLDGRTVRYDFTKPFATLAQMSESGVWRPQGDSKPH